MKQYTVEKKFLSGLFAGITTTVETSVKYKSGQTYTDYTGNTIKILSVKSRRHGK